MPTVSGIIVSTSAEATGRRTLSEIVDELARPVNASDSTVRALAGDAFRAAVRTMNRKGNWPWEIMEEEITMTSGQMYSTASGAIKKPLAMHYLDASGGTEDQLISYTPYPVFIEEWNLDISGEPHTYTIPNLFETGQIRWFPTPSATDYVKFDYYRVTPAPRSDNETVEIPDYAIEAYMARAWYEFIKRLPSGQRPFPIEIAAGEARQAFREITAHVLSPGDTSRG